MSRNVPLLFTLFGANVVMSIGPAHSSLCLISSHDLPSSAGFSPGRRAPQPLVRTSTHEPFSLKPSSVILRSPLASAASTSSTSGVQVPRSHSITTPAP